jgi:hypothetical protein
MNLLYLDNLGCKWDATIIYIFMLMDIQLDYVIGYTVGEFYNIDNTTLMTSPMDQFEIKPFFGEFLGLNYTPVGMFTNILVYIGLVVIFTIFFYVYGSFKDSIKING